MVAKKAKRILEILVLGGFVLLFTSSFASAAIEFDVPAIEAQIATAVANGADPVVAAKAAVADAVRVIVAANPNYPGGQEALFADILAAIATLKITGLDDTDLLISANHALGIATDPALEAYEAPGAQGRANARNRGGNAYGPGGKPANGSPT